MKKIGTYFGVLAFVTAYCYAISCVSAYNLSPASNKTEKDKHVVAVSTDLFSGFVSPQRSFSSSENLPNPNFKTSFGGFWILEKTYKAVFLSKYTQYVSFAKNAVFRFRKADIIFPFHYFW